MKSAVKERFSIPLLLSVMILAFVLPTRVYASPVSVSISPSSQSVPQGTTASYTVALSGTKGTSYSLSLSGLPGGTPFSFLPNPVSTPPGGGSGAGNSSLAIDTSNAPGLYCPGSYSFTVSAINSTALTPPNPGPPDTGSASATITIFPSGPPLGVTVAADKSAYLINDKVTLLMTVNRPSEGYLTVSPPSGAPYKLAFGPFLGSYSWSKILAANQIGHWNIVMTADDFCSGSSNAETSFDVTPNTYTVTITRVVSIWSTSYVTVTGIDISTTTTASTSTSTSYSEQITPQTATKTTVTVFSSSATTTQTMAITSSTTFSLSTTTTPTTLLVENLPLELGLASIMILSALVMAVAVIRRYAPRKATVCRSCGFKNPPHAISYCVKCGESLNQS
jgi:hypothetical protein